MLTLYCVFYISDISTKYSVLSQFHWRKLFCFLSCLNPYWKLHKASVNPIYLMKSFDFCLFNGFKNWAASLEFWVAQKNLQQFLCVRFRSCFRYVLSHFVMFCRLCLDVNEIYYNRLLQIICLTRKETYSETSNLIFNFPNECAQIRLIT